MSGNEQWLVPELFDFALRKPPPTRVYLNAERFAGAKRGGSPNLAKLACACRIMHDKLGLNPKLSVLKFPDPVDEFIEWMDYELDNGWMWNEQGPSPNYDWMHLLPQIVLANIAGHKHDIAHDWLRMYLEALDLGRAEDGTILQAGMRGVGHVPKVGFNEWLMEYLRTGTDRNKFFKKYFEKLDMYHVVKRYSGILRDAYKGRPESQWKVRVPQHWYEFENGKVVLVSRDGNGNTQARAADIKIGGGKRAIFPRDGGKRKQSDLDQMECWCDEGRMEVCYRSDLYSPTVSRFACTGAGKLVAHYLWDEHGLHRLATTPPVSGTDGAVGTAENVPDKQSPVRTARSPSGIWAKLKAFFRGIL